MSGLGPLIRGAKFVNATVNNISGAMDIYTCPVGKKAYISLVYGVGGSSTAGTYQIKVGGVYYNRSTVGLAIGGGTSTNFVPTVLNAGEGFAVNVTSGGGTGCIVWSRIVEMDISTPLYTGRLFSFSTGNNTLFTVTSGKTAMTLDVWGQHSYSPGTPNGYFNFSGGTRNISTYIVPNGGSPTSSNKFNGSASLANGSALQVATTLSMNGGDSIVISTDASTSTQLAYATYFEI